MLTLLSPIKARLVIGEFDLQYDTLLTSAIKSVSARFDKECNRTLSRTVNALQEFSADETEVRLATYPLESVTKFELKENETDGWVQQTSVVYLLRDNCVISISQPFSLQPLTLPSPASPIRAVTSCPARPRVRAKPLCPTTSSKP